MIMLRRNRRWSLSVHLSLLLLSSALAGTTQMNPHSIVANMEKVADWELENAGEYLLDAFPESDGRVPEMRILSDGSLQRVSRVGPACRVFAKLPTSWDVLVRSTSGDIRLVDLPIQVGTTWQRLGLRANDLMYAHAGGEGGSRGWEMATLYYGLMALSKISSDTKYAYCLDAIGGANLWNLGPRPYHADDLAVGGLYIECFVEHRDITMLAPVQARLDWILAHPPTRSLDIRESQDRWTWSDAMFMAAPVWGRMAAVTGDRRYLEYMDQEWWATTTSLFCARDGLFLRDLKFASRTEPNGRPVYWSRGNGWVLAALARIIPYLPADYPDRLQYIHLLTTMSRRIADLQPSDGLWRTSLLDPTSSPSPEESGTALICYAMARGVNEGMLDSKTFRTTIERAWEGLQRCVDANGRLGYVQQPGAGPASVDASSTAPYGVGAYLLAGSEVFTLAQRK